jgi:hypothetical protein
MESKALKKLELVMEDGREEHQNVKTLFLAS